MNTKNQLFEEIYQKLIMPPEKKEQVMNQNKCFNPGLSEVLEPLRNKIEIIDAEILRLTLKRDTIKDIYEEIKNGPVKEIRTK